MSVARFIVVRLELCLAARTVAMEEAPLAPLPVPGHGALEEFSWEKLFKMIVCRVEDQFPGTEK